MNKTNSQRPAEQRQDLKRQERGLPAIAGSAWRHLVRWFPQPVSKPRIDQALPDMPAIERVAESLWYGVLLLEYSLCPNGRLREWLKLWARLGLYALIPLVVGLVVLPLLLGVVQTFEAMALSLLRAVMYLACCLVIIIAFGFLFHIACSYMKKQQSGQSIIDVDDYEIR